MDMKTKIATTILLFALGQVAWGQVNYIECSWDAENMKVVKTQKTHDGCVTLGGYETGISLGNGWYVVSNEVEYPTINIIGDVHIILCDGARLTTSGVKLEGTSSLTIYGQTENTGKLDSDNENTNYAAGIGSTENKSCGNFIMHGGMVSATGGAGAAGIGGGKGAHSGSVTIFGGTVNAKGGDYAAGIGGGDGNGIDGEVTIYDCEYVNCLGGIFGAGIGGGDEGNQKGPVNIYGGHVSAVGQYDVSIFPIGGDEGGGAGIGGGDNGYGVDVNIYGGWVEAISRGYGAGIGGGHNRGFIGTVSIFGGKVDACGYDLSIQLPSTIEGGAGIGGGAGGSQSGKVVIEGGVVRAEGGYMAAGIGGGSLSFNGGRGGTVTINGGTVYAFCGKDCTPSEANGGCAIGSSSPDKTVAENTGALNINAKMMVSAGDSESSLSKAVRDERVSSCRWNAVVKIEKCDHADGTYNQITKEFHTGECTYCEQTYYEQAHSFSHQKCSQCGAVVLSDDIDCATDLALIQGSAPVVYLNRALFRDGSWNTLCLPFSLDADQVVATLGPKAIKTLKEATFSSTTQTLTLIFEDAATIEAGQPYLLRWDRISSAPFEPFFESVDITSASPSEIEKDVVTFKGTYNPVAFENENRSVLLLGGNNKLYYPLSGAAINAFRAFFQLNNGITAGDPTMGVNHFEMNFGNETTGIIQMKDEGSKMKDGDGAWFTLDGRKLNDKPSAKGIYINHGQKSVIK